MSNVSNRNILLLLGLMPTSIKDEIVKKSKGNVQFAANSLQYSLVKGLSHYFSNLHIINFPFTGAFPFLSKLFGIQATEEKVSSVTIYSKNFLNVVGLKNIFIYFKAVKSISKWANESEGSKVIFIYAAYLPFIRAALKVKEKCSSEIKVCIIIPDLIEYMNSPKNFIYRLFRNFLAKQIKIGLRQIDLFILLSEHMTERLPIKNKRHVVMEGIFESKGNTTEHRQITDKEKVILYSGHLAKRYGILNLVHAFSRIHIPNIKLVICGDGDSKDEIIKAATVDNRIQFLGVLNHEEVLRIQKNAFLLVNPRTSEGEFTRYSFPSKTLEYLASGVPTLLYRLQGIPEIYYNYCFTLTDPSIDKLKEKIEMILTKEPRDLKALGERAKSFIIENKNAISQCYKIYKLIEESYSRNY